MRITALVVAIIAISAALIYTLPSTKPVSATHGMVVTEQALASQVGIDILKAGGNAIDAAVAVGYALAVVDPCCGNIGGGGFMLIHLANNKNIFINFRERAPLAATKDMYLHANETASSLGYLAVATPGTVLGLDTALNLYGTMTRQQVMAPAIQLAQEGYTITPAEADGFAKYANDFRAQPNVAQIFLHHDKAYKAGQVLKQADLARTLQLIAAHGPEAFYRGPIANQIVAASKANGGLLSLADFNAYQVELHAPLSCTYQGYTIYSAPPPSSGGVTLCEMLNILEPFDLDEMSLTSAKRVRTIVEAMRFSFADRNSKLGDPDFVNNPINELLSKDYAATISQQIAATTRPLSKLSNLSTEHTDTTHYSIVDSKGNAVAVTYTLNGYFGANVIAGDTGFFLNDEMDDFTTQPGKPNAFGLVQQEQNAIQAGKRPLSSMTPTIVMKDDNVVMVLGSRGGPRIITSVLLTLLNVLDGHLNLQQAVNAPRFHFQDMPNVVYIEPDAISFLGRLLLEYRHYDFDQQHPWSAVEAIAIDDNNVMYGANDVRNPAGAAIGY